MISFFPKQNQGKFYYQHFSIYHHLMEKIASLELKNNNLEPVFGKFVRFKVEYSNSIDVQTCKALFLQGLLALYGKKGQLNWPWKLVCFDKDEQVGIFTTTTSSFYAIVAALALINSFHGTPCRVYPVRTGDTLLQVS